MNILVVDDNESNCKLLAKFLSKWGYNPIVCNSGEAAVEQCRNDPPDMILMDIMMPGMNGQEAAGCIKELSGTKHIPIIYVTALKEDQALADSLEAGGDDFVSKPIDKQVLFSKIRAHGRIRELNRELERKNSKLSQHNLRLSREQELVSHFFDRQQRLWDFDPAFVKYHTSAASAFNGDILFVKRRPYGGVNMILGDFTGHGLTAAMGSLPLSELFLQLTAEDASAERIAVQLNRYLAELLPAEVFLAATLVQLDATGRRVDLWAGGLPNGYVVKKTDNRIQPIESQHVPMGILGDDRFDSRVMRMELEPGDRLYLCTDGVVEAVDAEGRAFGETQLQRQLDTRRGDVIDRVRSSVFEFIGEERQDDDLSMVELTMTPVYPQHDVQTAQQGSAEQGNFPFSIEVKVNAEAMRSERSLNVVADMLAANGSLRPYKGVLYTIISELYTNALEHGILGLDSARKQDDSSYVGYYRDKERALDALSDAQIGISCTLCDDGKRVKIRVSHDGDGNELRVPQQHGSQMHGWGMRIVEELCQSVDYRDEGRCVEVTYDTGDVPQAAAQ